ncbi:tubulin epsilon and delta complex protein 2 isoform X2 [Betta splendens]|uniref:Tubulin epsilon and delta complex protein 2 isoform X2 n=1 Tax=Betta splendens TaxID=158456 RepID=A0A6P7NB41_BETSP|nr:tubulin epsilon and delta complex protein 2 isoform X2 [Betta splendens]
MSLLTTLEQTIKLYKAEQTKINDSIQHYREILQALTPQPEPTSEGSQCAHNSTADTYTSPEEKEDLELLERALEKALQVRTASEVSEKDPKRSKQAVPRTEPGAASASCKDGIQSSAPIQKTVRSKSAIIDRKLPKKPGSLTVVSKPSAGQSKTINNKKGIQNRPASSIKVVQHQGERKSQQAGSAHSSIAHTSTLHSKNTTIRSKRDDKPDEDATTSRGPHSHTDELGASSLPPQDWKPTEQKKENRISIEKWKSLRMRQNRLWDKVNALQKKPVPERSHFIERMRATFPKDWPSGSPDQIRALVDRLTHQGRDLIQHCQTKKLLAKYASEGTTELAENGNDSDQALESLQKTAEEIQDCAHQVKKEWEAWDRWKPEGGCLFPTGANTMWGVEAIAPLPPTITYTSEEELRELESLRMRVALLQQQVYLEQALSDTLSPQLSSLLAGPGCPKSSVLRDLYSLLGEGGERFPSTVLDCDTD